jgi:DNA polymerase I-like protein with 3'-5' exonuclease and polymerase domains
MELDYNACELRVLLALNGHKQPEMDLHDWNRENIFDNKYDRKEAKQKIFSWLYDNKVNEKASKYYDKNIVKEKFYKNGKVTNYYDREIDCDEQHSINYIVQSTASDMFLRRVLEIDKLLKGRKSKIAFMIHDSLIIDLCKEDRDLITEIEQAFSNTELGTFKTNISLGKNFGDMRKVK